LAVPGSLAGEIVETISDHILWLTALLLLARLI
jgi:hypothetical protein